MTLKRIFEAATPLIAVLVLIVFYVSFVFAFIECRWAIPGCGPITINNVSLENVSTPSPSPASSPQAILADKIHQVSSYSGRITWGFLVMIYILLSLVALAVAAGLIYKMFSDSGKRPLLPVLLTLAASAAFGFLLFNSSEIYLSILKPLLVKTIQTEVTHIVRVVIAVEVIGLASSFTLLLATCAILWPQNDDSLHGALRELSRRMNYLRIVLYVSTVVLVVGVLLMRSIFNWSLTFIPRTEGWDKAVESFTSSIVSAEAGFYTLTLAAIYLPAAFILQSRARSLKKLPKEESEKEKVLEGYGLSFSFKESLPRLLAILGPFLAGPVGELLKQFPK